MEANDESDVNLDFNSSEDEVDQQKSVITKKTVFGSDSESNSDIDKESESLQTKSPCEEVGRDHDLDNSGDEEVYNEEFVKKDQFNEDSDLNASPGDLSPEELENCLQGGDLMMDEERAEGVEDEADDDSNPELDETRIAVDFPLIRADLGKEMHLVKMPNFLSVETRPFDANFYEDEMDGDDILDEEGRTRLKLKVENTIRWRMSKTADGDVVHESNARIVRWSDGSLSLHLGDEIFDIHKLDIHSDYNYLFIREGSGLQGQSSLKTKLTFRPHSTDSFTHRKITLSLADKTNKSQKVKILPVAGADPETNRNELVRKEEEKLRATLRRESQIRRMRERQAMNRSSYGGDRRRSSGYGGGDDDDDDDEDDDGNTTSLNALKRKNLIAASSRKELATVYSSDSESLSDLSAPSQRKKVRAKISDEEDSD